MSAVLDFMSKTISEGDQVVLSSYVYGRHRLQTGVVARIDSQRHQGVLVWLPDRGKHIWFKSSSVVVLR